MRATIPGVPLKVGFPAASKGALPKIYANVPKVAVMPIEPRTSKGLRPNLSTKAIAIKVVTIFTIAVITVIVREFCSENPTARHKILL